MPELRKDPIFGRWVIIATERAQRPSDYARGAPEADAQEACPFCEGREAETLPEIAAVRANGSAPNTPGWQVRVVPHKYAVLRIEGATDATLSGMHLKMGGVGAHEVIIESPRHDEHPAVMPPEQLASALWMYRERYRDLNRDQRFKYLLLFRNHGRFAAAHVAHPISQLIALPIVPKRASEELEGAQRFFAREGRCVFCDIIRQEQAEQTRLVCQNDDFIAFAPYAAWCPFELWILPKAHAASFGQLGDEQIPSLAKILREALGRYHACLGNPPYHYVVHTAPYTGRADHYYHWHIEAFPRFSLVAGFESGSGFYINTTPPEDAARYLREAVPPPAGTVHGRGA